MPKLYHSRRPSRLFLPVCLLLSLLLICVLLLTHLFRPTVSPDPPTPLELPAHTWPFRVLRGQVADCTMGTLSVEDAQGRVHRFDRDGTPVAAGQSGLLIGARVAVAYLDAPDRGVPARALFAAVSQSPEPQPPPPTPEEIAESLLDSMTLEEKVGQMFIARRPKGDAPGEAARWALGGYLLFTRDIRGQTPETLGAEIQACQQAAGIPMFIGVDEEGGSVVRISKFPAFRAQPFPSPQELWQAGGLTAVREDAAEKSRLLRSLGFNLNFAPVCDVSQDPQDYIYSRTLGLDGAQTADYVRAVVEEMSGQGMGCVLKHFPGYGGSRDTHTAVVRDDRPLEVFIQSDLLPFQAGIEAGAGMVLVSHNIVSCMDSSLPASLSPRVHEILREDLGFQGVIVTDDLSMSGAADFAGTERAAVLAVLAGNDLLCTTDYQLQIPAVLQAVEAGEIPLSRIDQSVLRILMLKLSLGLIPAP